MKKFNLLKSTALVAMSALLLTACSGGNTEAPAAQSSSASQSAAVSQPEGPVTVEITDIYGTVTVPVNPQRVVALDNRTFETLYDWGIEVVAVPKDVMPDDMGYVLDESVQNIGNHREPNLELLAAADPELVIVGQRFASYYEEIKTLVPNAAVINLNFDVSESAATPGANLVDGLKNSTIALGMIFEKSEEAEALCAEFDQAIADVSAAYNGTDTVMSLVVSGGNIGFSAPGSGRVWGPMYEVFGWVPSLSIDNSTSDHQGDEIGIEAIADSNPDWIFVLDRDAATTDAGTATPAKDVVESAPALQNVTAITEGHVVYAPADTYTNESIQTYLELFSDIAAALNA